MAITHIINAENVFSIIKTSWYCYIMQYNESNINTFCMCDYKVVMLLLFNNVDVSMN